MTKKHVGKKRENPEQFEKSYIIYSDCYECPLKAYVDVICNNNLNALIVSGKVDKDTLNKAFEDIVNEFNDISGNSLVSRQTALSRQIYMYRSQIIALNIANCVILFGGAESVTDILIELGIKYMNAKSDHNLMEKISAKISEKRIRLKKLNKEYANLTNNNKKEITPAFFIEQLVELSRWAGFKISMDITVAEFAVYIRKMNECVKQLKLQQHGAKY